MNGDTHVLAWPSILQQLATDLGRAMTTTIEGTELTRIEPGTVMGGLMRQYWLRPMLSSEFARDGAPIRLMLLGEKLLAFRDSAGKRGVSTMTQPQPAFRDGTPIGSMGRGNKFLPNTTVWLGCSRPAANPSNDWQIDRMAQQDGTIYSVIEGVHLQDQAITESMGPITDHAIEHPAPSDQMITRTRRRLLIAARALRDKNALPPGVEDPEAFRAVCSGHFVSDDTNPWQEIYAKQFAASVRPTPATLHAAE
jgi:hypothetical protein